MSDLSAALCAIAGRLNCNFILRDQPIEFEKVFSEVGLLPSIMKRADQLSNFCLGYGLGATYEDTPGTLGGLRVAFDDKTSQALRLLCVTDVLVELMHLAPSRDKTPLDDLLFD